MNEVFAEYFINEFEDPLNAYTGGMANYGGAAATLNLGSTIADNNLKSVASTSSNKQSVSLPTGGIRTSFHTGSLNPVSKKSKMSHDGLEVANEAAANGAAPILDSVRTTTSDHLDAPAAAQELFLAPKPGQSSAIQSQRSIQLPIGVGIRLGALGGLSSQTAHLRSTEQLGMMVPGTQFPNLNHTMWAVSHALGGHNNQEGLSKEAAEERRQRNREHAKRSRVRKKFLLESLQKQVQDLQKENNLLRMQVQEHIPQHAMQIISECCSKNPLFDENAEYELESEAGPGSTDKTKNNLARSDFSLINSLMSGQRCFLLSDPTLPDNPIVFASPDFYKMTGYTSKEVLGRNCRFLQGEGTDKQSVDVIRTAIATGSDASVCILNYKADGTPFWNQFFIGALRDADNSIVNFVRRSL